jgi:hypothetical protein
MVAGGRVESDGRKDARFPGYTDAGRGHRSGRIAPALAQLLVTESGKGIVLVEGG